MRLAAAVITSVGALLPAALASALTPGTAVAASPGWSIVPSPNPTGTSGAQLTGVSCASDGTCMAVGYRSGGQTAQTLAEYFNGTRWAIVRTPNATDSNTLDGVSCARPGACTAVGVSISSKSVVRALAENWNGHSWSIVPTPAVGGPGASAALEAVSCLGPASCMAVGSFTGPGVNTQSQPLAEHWNGSAWTVLRTPNPHAENGSFLDSVSCVAASACTAAAGLDYGDVDQSIYALRWDGTTWSTQAQPNPGGQGQNSENSISCASTTACTTVGSWIDTADNQLTLAEGWNGSSWMRETTPNPAGTTGQGLNGVSCITATNCTAVGDSTGSGGSGSTLAEQWNGSAWTLQLPPNPAGAVYSILAAVTCGQSDGCTAVGNFYNGSAVRTLVERYTP